jgi:hypothetical protein
MVGHRQKLAALLLSACVGFASHGPVIAADQQSVPVASKSIAKQLRAALDAINQKQYDVALADVKEAQAVPAKKSAYDNYVIDSLLFHIYAGKGDSTKAMATLESIARSQFATRDWLKATYLALAQYEYKLGAYEKTLDLVRFAVQYGATEDETASLIASAERSRASELRWRKSDRISELRPRRRDTPLRYLNISDNEVREIQLAAATNPPYEFVSIGGVVTGCPAEDGPACTDQVWVELRRQGKTSGLLLSKVNDQWIIGAIQQWYLCDEALEARRESFSTYFEYMAAKEALVENFPSCIDQPAITAQP